jgi:hypothetical protein
LRTICPRWVIVLCPQSVLRQFSARWGAGGCACFVTWQSGGLENIIYADEMGHRTPVS